MLDLASAELQDDREVVLHCVKNAMHKGDAIKHASARLRGDKEIILAAAEKWQSATVLNLASSELQDDREVVLHCVKNNGDAIKHASARLRGDKEIILAAARERNSDTVLSFASTELQDDREVVLRCVELTGRYQARVKLAFAATRRSFSRQRRLEPTSSRTRSFSRQRRLEPTSSQPSSRTTTDLQQDVKNVIRPR